MLTAKWPAAATVLPVEDVLLRQTRTIGGSSDSELTALAVEPLDSPAWVAVITVTPLAK